MTIVGIDLGTTRSSLAVQRDGRVRVIAGEAGCNSIPSVVASTTDGTALVGEAAQRQAILNPTGTIAGVKRLMGERQVVLGERQVAPEEISATILGRLRELAEDQLGEAVTEAVIAVPAYFDDRQRRATKDAATIAGLETRRMLSEPTAAALAYAQGRQKLETIAVYDFGGGTFDISVVDLDGEALRVRAVRGNTRLGGQDFDRRIADFLIERLDEQCGVDVRDDPVAMQRIYIEAERAKHVLSNTVQTTIDLPFLTTTDAGEPWHFQQDLTRPEVEDLVADLVEESLECCEACLDDAGMPMSRLDKVLLVGGQTRMPFVQEAVRSRFGQLPHRGVHPQEAVVIGAAHHAAQFDGHGTSNQLTDVTPLSLGIEVQGGIMHAIIERNTPIPVRRTSSLAVAQSDQDFVRINIFQGERAHVEENRQLGAFELYGIESTPGEAALVDLVFEIDGDGVLEVSARDRRSGRQQKLRAHASSGLTGKELTRLMLNAKRSREA